MDNEERARRAPLLPPSRLGTFRIMLVTSAIRIVRAGLTTVTNRRSRWALVALAAMVMNIVAGCSYSERASSQASPSTEATIAEEPHTRFDVLFARDIIEHSAQAVALSNLAIGKDGVAPQVVDVARQIAASSTGRMTELQALLLDWGFAPMTARSVPPVAAPGVPLEPGNHPLATDADFRLLRDAVGSLATDVFLELMIRQHQFAISAARDELRSGLHPGAMAIARLLIESQQAETAVMEALKR